MGPPEPSSVDRADAIVHAARVLSSGGLVAFPTETVYGLGADAENVGAVERIFAVKGRPSTHPLIVHIGASEQVQDWAAGVLEPARLLAERFWPGPLTLVLRRGSGAVCQSLRVRQSPRALATFARISGAT